MNSIKKKFKIEKNSEIAMEIDPTSVSKKNLIANLKNFFFNRVSIGVQDFSPEVQKIINKKQILIHFPSFYGISKKYKIWIFIKIQIQIIIKSKTQKMGGNSGSRPDP